MHGIGFVTAFLAGLLSVLSPCILPLVPAFLTLISGLTFEELSEGGNQNARWQAVAHAFAFVVGFSVVFIVLGASATLIGGWLGHYSRFFERLGGAFVILFGFFLLGWIKVPLLQREARVHWREKPVGYLGSALVGATFGFGWTPCVGPILGSILILAGSSGSVGQGVSLLAVYSLGLAIPFLLAALALDRFLVLFKKYKGFSLWAEKIAGGLLVIIGFLILSGWFRRLTQGVLANFGAWTEWVVRLGL